MTIYLRLIGGSRLQAYNQPYISRKTKQSQRGM